MNRSNPEATNFINPIAEPPARHEITCVMDLEGIHIERCGCGLLLLTLPGGREHWMKFDGEIRPVRDAAYRARILATPCQLKDPPYHGDDPEEAAREPQKDRAGKIINRQFFCSNPDLHDEFEDHYCPGFADELNFVEEKLALKRQAFDEGYGAAMYEVRTALYNGKCPVHGERFKSCGKCKQFDEYRRR